MENWERLAGYARIYSYDPQKGARYYIGKYAFKGGEIDINVPEVPYKWRQDAWKCFGRFDALRRELRL
jgi:hypothetical protein